MEGVRGQHERHDNNDKEENKGWFAMLLLQSLQPYTATCALNSNFYVFARILKHIFEKSGGRGGGGRVNSYFRKLLKVFSVMAPGEG